jgi:hypothetical protein
MSWHEFVHVEVQIFYAGEHPWTDEDFYANSCIVNTTPSQRVGVLDVVQTIFEHEGPRVASATGWWEEGVWWLAQGGWTQHALDSSHKLTCDAWRFEFTPLQCGVGDKHSMIQYEIDGGGYVDTFRPHLEALKQLLTAPLGVNKCGSFMTVWHCDAGKDEDTWAGPGEFWSEWYPVRVAWPEDAAKPSGGAA